jgi:hypothetical protein
MGATTVLDAVWNEYCGMQSLFPKDFLNFVDVLASLRYTRVEAGSNTSTVTLRVVRGDEMVLKKRPRHSLSG